MSRKLMAASGAAAVAALLSVANPAAAAGVKVGVLSCHVSSGWGFIFGSSKDLHCNFSPSGRGFGERYVGSVSKFGVDIGYTSGGVLIWDVLAPTSTVKRGALAGAYAGVTGSATVGVGAGANVLVGGFNRSITLQPVSIEGNTGLNVAAGIGEITLHYEAPEMMMRAPGEPPPDAPPPPPPG